MVLKFETDVLVCDIDTPDKYAFIVGLSGVGKTYLVSTLFDTLNRTPNIVHSSGVVFLIQNIPALDLIPGAIRDYPGCIFVVDELLARAVLDATVNQNCCVLAIFRSAPSYVNHSYRSVYTAYRQDTGTTCLRRTYVDIPAFRCFEFDTLVTEDSGAGYEFFSKYYQGSVLSGKGRDKVYRVLKDNLLGPNIMLVLDGGGLCDALRNISEAMVKLASLGYRFGLCVPESFEEILLGAPFINFNEDILQLFRYSDNNTESLCERLIKEKTQGTSYAYDHDRGGFQTNCWLKDCVEDCPRCSSYIAGSKKSVILDGNKHQALLDLKPAQKEVINMDSSLLSAIGWCVVNPYKWGQTCIPEQDVVRLGLRYNKQYLLRHADVFMYCYVTKVTDTYYVEFSLVQNGPAHYIPRGKSYASFKDAPVIEL